MALAGAGMYGILCLWGPYPNPELHPDVWYLVLTCVMIRGVPRIHKRGFLCNKCARSARKIFEATPIFALTTPVFDQRRRGPSYLSRLTVDSRLEIAQKHS